MSEIDFSSVIESLPELFMDFGLRIVMALVIFFVGKWIAKGVMNILCKTMQTKGVDETICKFVRNLGYYALLTMVIIVALGKLGLQTASFVAVIGAAGLAIGLALQGSLSNFAAGVLLVLFRPFKSGDFIEAGGTSGIVDEISIFTTILRTPDNKTVIIANSNVLGSNIVNYSTQEKRRVDITVGVSYNSKIDVVKQELQVIADEESRLLENEDVTIAVAELADSSVNLVFRVWVKTEDYWGVYFDLTEKIKLRFDEKNIEIPFPQMDVHVSKDAA